MPSLVASMQRKGEGFFYLATWGREADLHTEEKFMEQKLFEQLVTSVKEMVAIENGKMEPLPENVHRHAILDVKSLRGNASMSQADSQK